MNVTQENFNEILKKHGMRQGKSIDELVGDFKESLMLLQVSDLESTMLKFNLMAASAKIDKLLRLPFLASAN